MTERVEAVYENGVLKPLGPLPIAEHQRVVVYVVDISQPPEATHLDYEYTERIKKEMESTERIPTLEEVQQLTSKDPDSWADLIAAEREERF